MAKSSNDRVLKHRYGINRDVLDFLIEEQDGKCKICHKEFDSSSKPHVDHNHTTGDVRGILCRNCNLALGYFKDDILLLWRAMNYLSR